MGDIGYHMSDAKRGGSALVEIGPDAAAQRGRFPHISDPTNRILHQINARLIRQAGKFFLQSHTFNPYLRFALIPSWLFFYYEKSLLLNLT